jgi:hypothetical protein
VLEGSVYKTGLRPPFLLVFDRLPSANLKAELQRSESQPTLVSNMLEATFLDRLEKLCNVDIDDVDVAVIASLPFKPHNRQPDSSFRWLATLLTSCHQLPQINK